MSNINSSFGNRAATQVTFFPTADISAINVQEAIVEVSNEKANINHTHTASDVGLGNVTNESKTTMFTNPTFTGTATATTFSGELNGNATTATKLQTVRTINGVSFDGSANITIAAGGIGGIQTFTSSGTFTVPTGVTTVYVSGCGGGGAGGGNSVTNTSRWGGAGGGGAGACAYRTPLSVTPGSQITVTIGAGGTGANGNGNAGGTTSFGALLSLSGGGGGGQTSVPYVGTGGLGGASGGLGGGAGRHGLNSLYDSTNFYYANRGGEGGSGLFGTGGSSPAVDNVINKTSASGGAGSGYGAGGGGVVARGNALMAGANGSAGLIIVEW